jgi:molybdopterin converting factor small subunit
MATVYVPAPLRNLTGGLDRVEVDGRTLRQVIEQLDREFPGMKGQLVEDDVIRSGIAIAVNDVLTESGLLEPVPEAAAIRILPAIGGGDRGGSGVVEAVSISPGHTLAKANQASIRLVAGIGIEGDVHSGAKVKHRSRVRRDPEQPNLRQVHLIQAELHDELIDAGFSVAAGIMGENVTTRGIDLLGLPTGARLHLGVTAVIEVTGLRNPCDQLDGIQPGLMNAVLDRDASGGLVRKAGVMAVVLSDGEVRPGDPVRVELPPPPHQRLEPV